MYSLSRTTEGIMEQTSATTPLSTFADVPARSARVSSPKQQFLDVFRRESATTRRVLNSVPDAQGEFKPSPNNKTAREIAAIFSLGQGGIAAALTDNWQWPPQFPAAPATYAEVVANFEATNQAVLQALENTPESRLLETVTFFTAPKTMGPIPVIELMWFMLLDSIHHRGQLTVYLRMMGAKVPSIYGPSADEPWA
jgi:uncharacterized damage-inducible protein DinB